MNGKNIAFKKTYHEKNRVTQDGLKGTLGYNDAMANETDTVKKDISRRLTELRLKKGVSARKMSLDLGQNAGYINSIENALVLPSVAMLSEICDYLGVSLWEFFEYSMPEGDKYLGKAIISAIPKLNSAEREVLLKLIDVFNERQEQR